jgi:hypothetical protein
MTPVCHLLEPSQKDIDSSCEKKRRNGAALADPTMHAEALISISLINDIAIVVVVQGINKG